MFDNLYKKKTALITGHTGFKGSWLAIWLKELGADVIGYSLAPPSEPNNFEATRLREKITHIHGDIRDLDRLIETFKKYEPEFVFHLAAQPIVRLSYDEPKMTFDTNVGGTVNVFEAVRKTLECTLILSLSKDRIRYRTPGFCPSAAASARAGNVIGGGDWGTDRLVPDCIRALSRHQAIGIRSPHAIRPWQHVLAPLGGYLQLGAALWQDPQKYSGAWNFGPDDGSHLTVAEMADRLIKYWGDGSWNDLSDPQALHEANLLKLNCDKAHAGLNWHSVLTNDECLQMTADWYREFYSGNQENNMYQFCVAQIHQYAEMMVS